MVELAANVDDATGEVLAHTVAALLAAGAHDAWITPIVMKKGRPAHTVHVLCDPALAGAVGAVLLAETGSLGLRATAVERWPQVREELVVDLDGQPVRVKRAGPGSRSSTTTPPPPLARSGGRSGRCWPRSSAAPPAKSDANAPQMARS